MVVHDHRITPSSQVGVTAELQEIAARRAAAISLWDGPIQSLWGSLLWYEEQARSLAALIARGNRERSTADAFVRCLDTLSDVIEEIGRREAQARARVRGMDGWIASAKQHSRQDAKLAEAWLNHQCSADLVSGRVAS